MKNQAENFSHLSSYLKHCCKRLQLTRDDIVRATGMCSDKASAVWNGKDVRLSYYIQVWRLLFKRSFHPRYKFSPIQLLEGLLQAIKQELSG